MGLPRPSTRGGAGFTSPSGLTCVWLWAPQDDVPLPPRRPVPAGLAVRTRPHWGSWAGSPQRRCPQRPSQDLSRTGGSRDRPARRAGVCEGSHRPTAALAVEGPEPSGQAAPPSSGRGSEGRMYPARRKPGVQPCASRGSLSRFWMFLSVGHSLVVGARPSSCPRSAALGPWPTQRGCRRCGPAARLRGRCPSVCPSWGTGSPPRSPSTAWGAGAGGWVGGRSSGGGVSGDLPQGS